jgi:hypothetical protein
MPVLGRAGGKASRGSADDPDGARRRRQVQDASPCAVGMDIACRMKMTVPDLPVSPIRGEEVPMSYKDIESVMAAQSDPVQIVARFDPKLVKMAPEGERPED